MVDLHCPSQVAAGCPSSGEPSARYCVPLLNHLARVGTQAADGTLAPTGLRPRHLVALTLLAEHGPTSQQALAVALSLDPRNVVGLLNDLEERELVTRRRDAADRRRHIVAVSQEGRDRLLDAQQRLGVAEAHLLRALSDDERATLHDLLARAADGHRPDPAGDPCAGPGLPPCPDGG